MGVCILHEKKNSDNFCAMKKKISILVKVGKNHVEDCKTLLKYMGVPYIQAPCEAESQCAQLVKAKLVDAVGTEDMDALTFGSTLLLRHLTFSEARKMPIKEFHLCMYSFIRTHRKPLSLGFYFFT